VLRDLGNGTGDPTRPVPSGGIMKGTGVTCGTHPEGPHTEGTTQRRSGIPWAEKWPAVRACGSVVILTLWRKW
jgi:hypothetical protein